MSYERGASATLTLKNISDDVFDRLKAAAVTNRRSVNSEAIACLEIFLSPLRVTAAERLARARALREALRPGWFTSRAIKSLKRRGNS